MNINDSPQELDPNKTICVVKHNGKKVGQVPATASNAEQYLTDMVKIYKDISVDYEEDTTGGLLNLLHKDH